MERHSDTVTLNGLETYYESCGSGEPLLLLHGWTQSSSLWRAYIPRFSDRFQVITPDLLGHGRSAPFKGTFSLNQAVDNLLDLMDHLDLKKARALGFSYGGETALNAASRRPESFGSLVLVGSSHRFEKQDWGLHYDKISPREMHQLAKIHIHGEEQIRSFFHPNRKLREYGEFPGDAQNLLPCSDSGGGKGSIHSRRNRPGTTRDVEKLSSMDCPEHRTSGLQRREQGRISPHLPEFSSG